VLRKCLVDIFNVGARWRVGVVVKFIDILKKRYMKFKIRLLSLILRIIIFRLIRITSDI
jgi:hypothetical protein